MKLRNDSLLAVALIWLVAFGLFILLNSCGQPSKYGQQAFDKLEEIGEAVAELKTDADVARHLLKLVDKHKFYFANYLSLKDYVEQAIKTRKVSKQMLKDLIETIKAVVPGHKLEGLARAESYLNFVSEI